MLALIPRGLKSIQLRSGSGETRAPPVCSPMLDYTYVWAPSRVRLQAAVFLCMLPAVASEPIACGSFGRFIHIASLHGGYNSRI